LRQTILYKALIGVNIDVSETGHSEME